jgi:hypothetical protein
MLLGKWFNKRGLYWILLCCVCFFGICLGLFGSCFHKKGIKYNVYLTFFREKAISKTLETSGEIIKLIIVFDFFYEMIFVSLSEKDILVVLAITIFEIISEQSSTREANATS